jgi:anti-sigma B factor antagonist
MVRPTNFEIAQTADRSAPVLSITGELDMDTTLVLSERVEQQLAERPAALTLDLRQLTFMDSSGLRFLIALYDRSRRDSWRLRLVSPRSASATLVLRATGADTALPFEREPDP